MKQKHLFFFLLLFLFSALNVSAQRVMEQLNRGLVAVRVSTTQTFLSWRVLGGDPDDVAFNLYRNGEKINENPISENSNYNDNQYQPTNIYEVRVVLGGIETGEKHQASVWSSNYLEIPLQRPAGMTMPDNSTCTYSPNDASVGDVDGDGEFEIILKWEPSNAKDNSQGGYTGNVYIDAYKMNGTHLWRIDLGKNIRAGAHYTQFIVADFDGDGKSEVAMKTAPGTKDASGNYISKGPAATTNHATDYRNPWGYILSGPEYFTVFSGETGMELATANYDPPRGNVNSWGDDYGNRVDRFLASAAWLDGVLPSIIMVRGYYTRAVVAAWDYRNGQLTKRWTYDSGNTWTGLAGQGNHNMSVGDVDNDGKDEILWGSAALDHDGKVLYTNGLGHGDAMHVSDMDPDRPGLEVFSVKENSGSPYGHTLHDARTGVIIQGIHSGTDNGRGCAANLLANTRGFEMWSASIPNVYNVNGSSVGSSKPAMNFRIYWTGDLQSELLDGNTISKYLSGSIFSASGCSSNNGSKSTPSLSADILGDWREEVIFRTNDNTKLRIYTTTAFTQHKMYTLMHDDVYRNAIAWQNGAYNQPPHAGFYIGADMDKAPASAVYSNEKRWKSGDVWNLSATTWSDSTGTVTGFANGDKVLFDISAGNASSISIDGVLEPTYLKVNSPWDVEFKGEGSLTGDMYVRKTGAGKLIFNNDNDFSGTVSVWSGEFHNNGTLSATDVMVYGFSTLLGDGVFKGNVTLSQNASVHIGNKSTIESASLEIEGNLTEKGKVNYTFDFTVDNGAVVSIDTLLIGGNWSVNANSVFNIRIVGGDIPAGSYTLATITGNIVGDIAKIKINGIPNGLGYYMQVVDGVLKLNLQTPVRLMWNGTVDARWNIANTVNWLEGTQDRFFVAKDTVVFTDEALWKTVIIEETVEAGEVIVDAESNYVMLSSGGRLDGIGNLVKQGTGKLTLSGNNTYTGKTIVRGGTLETSSLPNALTPSPIGAAGIAPENIQLDGGNFSFTGYNSTTDRGFYMGMNSGTFSIQNSNTQFSVSGKISGPGKLIKDGNGRLGISTNNNFSGGTLIKKGSIALLNDLANTAGLGTDTITFEGGSLVMFNSESTSNNSNWKLHIPAGSSGSLTTDGYSTIAGSITGGGTLNYYTHSTGNMLSSDVSAYQGTLNITTDADGGKFVVYNTKGYPNTHINLNNRVNMVYRVTTNITLPIGDLTGGTLAELGAGGTGSCRINWEIGARNANSTFNGIINNSQYSGSNAVAAITKVGTGTWTLTNANSYGGGTEIKNGTIMVNNTTGSATGTGDVLVKETGRLAGKGSVSGKVTVASGATLAPGDGLGNLNIGGSVNIQTGGVLEIDFDKSTTLNDRLVAGGGLVMDGILKLNALSETPLQNGDTLHIVSGGVEGMLAGIIPSRPSNDTYLEWDLSEWSEGKLIVKTSTGLFQAETSYGVYPNPFDNRLKVTLNTTPATLEIRVSTLTGQLLYQNSAELVNEMDLDLQHLTKGLYILEIIADNKSTTTKIIRR